MSRTILKVWQKFSLCFVAITLLSKGFASFADWQVFSEVSPDTSIRFPEDHGLHSDFTTEWWYLTANLRDGEGKRYGIQYTLFSRLEDYNRQHMRFYFAHAALSTERDFFYAERYARGDFGHAGVDTSPFSAFIDDWQLTGDTDSPLPGVLQVSADSFAYTLRLSDAQYFLQGDDGFSAKNASGSVASHYYSAPFISLSGTLLVDGETIAVNGEGWLDREWSSRIWGNQDLGWDWLSLRLNENTALMLYQLRSEGEQHLSGTIMYKSGKQVMLAQNEIHWVPTRTKVFTEQAYPIEWSLKVPAHGVDIRITPINDDQYLQTRIPYWEGAVYTRGTHNGEGYLELFGAR